MTGLFIHMDKKIEKKIIEEYLKGKGSTTLTKEFAICKSKILEILNNKNLIRKRDRCDSLSYSFDGTNYATERICSKCKNTIITKSKDKKICCRNHFNKIKKNSLCKPCSLSLQIGEGNPFFGKKHTKKTIKKISKSRKGKATGNNNAMSNPKWRKKASNNLKKKWESGQLEGTRKIMSQHMKNSIKCGKIKSVNKSKKEGQIIEFLKEKKIRSIQSYKVDTKICDIYIPKYNLIIEYFGDYWHCNPKKYDRYYLNKKKGKTAQEIWDYDRSKIDLIKNFGYNIEVIWEQELKNNNNKIIEIIHKYDPKTRFTPEWSTKDSDTSSPI
jgi:G:T-mismatch repair DNA endonuclease (very short patch repair protein)